MRKEVIVLYSGGIDSTSLLAKLSKELKIVTCITFDYHQTHSAEIKAAKRFAKLYNIHNHIISKLSFRNFKKTSLIKKAKDDDENLRCSTLNLETYVPFRNMFFLTYASAIAEKLNIHEIYIGANEDDRDDFPDCRIEFLNSFEQTANLGSSFSLNKSAPLKIHAPFISKSKREIVEIGIKHGVDFFKTHTCYRSEKLGSGCGVCSACKKRIQAFTSLNIVDPIKYIKTSDKLNINDRF
jgi:7-cyano-7-deazaguanine synthase